MQNNNSPLTAKQQEQKLAFCLITGAAFTVLAVWGLLWTLYALTCSVFSVIHFTAFTIGGTLGFTLLSIAVNSCDK